MQAGLHHSLTEAVSTAYKLNGFSGFYVGYGTTIMREVNLFPPISYFQQIPFSLIQFPIYEKLKLEIAKFRDGQAPTSYEAALCGSISGAFAAGVTTPLDVLKTRRMLTLSTSSSSPVNF